MSGESPAFTSLISFLSMCVILGSLPFSQAYSLTLTYQTSALDITPFRLHLPFLVTWNWNQWLETWEIVARQ